MCDLPWHEVWHFSWSYRPIQPRSLNNEAKSRDETFTTLVLRVIPSLLQLFSNHLIEKTPPQWVAGSRFWPSVRQRAERQQRSRSGCSEGLRGMLVGKDAGCAA